MVTFFLQRRLQWRAAFVGFSPAGAGPVRRRRAAHAGSPYGPASGMPRCESIAPRRQNREVSPLRNRDRATILARVRAGCTRCWRRRSDLSRHEAVSTPFRPHCDAAMRADLGERSRRMARRAAQCVPPSRGTQGDNAVAPCLENVSARWLARRATAPPRTAGSTPIKSASSARGGRSAAPSACSKTKARSSPRGSSNARPTTSSSDS